MPSYYSSFANASTRFSTQEIPVSLHLYPSLAQCSSMLLGTRMSGFLSLSLLHKCRSKLLAPGCQFLFCPSLFHKNAAACFLAQECQVLFLCPSFANAPASLWARDSGLLSLFLLYKYSSRLLALGCHVFFLFSSFTNPAEFPPFFTKCSSVLFGTWKPLSLPSFPNNLDARVHASIYLSQNITMHIPDTVLPVFVSISIIFKHSSKSFYEPSSHCLMS